MRFTHAPMPEIVTPAGPPDQVTFTHQHTNCYGSCPAYTIIVHGDGLVEYHGSVADLTGDLTYRIAPEAALALINRQQARDLWNMQDQYVSAQTDASHDVLTIAIAGQKKSIHDYLGKTIGMPPAITAAEDDIDTTGDVATWLHMTTGSLKRLDDLHFNFKSQQASDMLVNMIEDRETDDSVVFALIDRGVPFDGNTFTFFPDEPRPPTLPVDTAITSDRPAVFARLIAGGGLQRDRKLDQGRVDSAFDAAITADRLPYMQKLAAFHPSLTYGIEHTDYGTDPETTAMEQQSVLFLVEGNGDDDIATIKYLMSMGADVKARSASGGTLLHSLGNNAEIVQYLIAQGIDLNLRNEFGETALLATVDEDAALVLLDAGADPNMTDENGTSIFDNAKLFNWQRVPAWLAAHGYNAPPETQSVTPSAAYAKD